MTEISQKFDAYRSSTDNTNNLQKLDTILHVVPITVKINLMQKDGDTMFVTPLDSQDNHR